MKNIVLLIAAIGFAFAQSCLAADAKFADGRAILQIKLATSQVVEVKIQTSTLDNASPLVSSFKWGGDKTFHPKSYISSFNVTVDKSAVPISLSAYADLGNPYDVTFRETSQGFELFILGGDAGVGYKSIYSFERVDGQIWLHSRKVVLLEFPDQAWEETTYSDPVKTD